MDSDDLARRGRRIALIIAGTGVLWIASTAIGVSQGWTARTQGLFDLAALAGFGWALWMIYGLWRDRQKDKD